MTIQQTIQVTFNKAADAVVRAYTAIDRPAVNFMDLLMAKGYVPESAIAKDYGELAIRRGFAGLGRGVETVVDAAEWLDRPATNFFDLLELKGYLTPALATEAGNVTAFAVNDNLAPTTGGGREAA